MMSLRYVFYLFYVCLKDSSPFLSVLIYYIRIFDYTIKLLKYREGNLVLNEAEKDNPHMKRMAEQFKLFNLQLTYPADGPDCVEGGNRIIDRKARQSEKPVIVTRKSTRSQNKYRV